MKKQRTEFKDIDILKEKQKLRILEQEMRIRAGVRELGDRLAGRKLRQTIEEGIVGNSGLAFKLGFMAVSLIMSRARKRKRK